MTDLTPVAVGRIVHYKMNQQDCDAANRNADPYRHNQARAGDVYPAVVVRCWAPSVNLRVFLDSFDDYWATSRVEGDGHGQWSWPPRV